MLLAERRCLFVQSRRARPTPPKGDRCASLCHSLALDPTRPRRAARRRSGRVASADGSITRAMLYSRPVTIPAEAETGRASALSVGPPVSPSAPLLTFNDVLIWLYLYPVRFLSLFLHRDLLYGIGRVAEIFAQPCSRRWKRIVVDRMLAADSGISRTDAPRLARRLVSDGIYHRLDDLGDPGRSLCPRSRVHAQDPSTAAAAPGTSAGVSPVPLDCQRPAAVAGCLVYTPCVWCGARFGCEPSPGRPDSGGSPHSWAVISDAEDFGG